MKLSIIIPTLNEEEFLQNLLNTLKKSEYTPLLEIIVVDGGSVDKTKAIAKNSGCKFLETTASRARQMNAGARNSTGDVLYFVHADVIPPISFYKDIQNSLKDGFDAGCYRFRFDSPKLLLKLNGFFTRFNKIWCRGGDQTLFIKNDVFKNLGGYDEYYSIMEEYELIKKLIDNKRFRIMPKDVIVSARKYESNSWLKVQLINLRAFRMFRNGQHPDKIKKFYLASLK